MKRFLRIFGLSFVIINTLSASAPARAASAQFTDVSAAAGVDVTHSLFGTLAEIVHRLLEAGFRIIVQIQLGSFVGHY